MSINTSSTDLVENTLDRLVEHLQDENEGHQVAITLALLIYLRWVGFHEEQKVGGVGYKSLLPENLLWSSWCEEDWNYQSKLLIEELPSYLQTLDSNGPNVIVNQLQSLSVHFNAISCIHPNNLHRLICWLAEQAFETQDDRKNLLIKFDRIIEDTSSKKSGGFKTPESVSKLMIELAAPTVGEEIYDPCFGSAGLLTAAIDFVRKANNIPVIKSHNLINISGIEINNDNYIIGLVRVLLSGIDRPNLLNGNVFECNQIKNYNADSFDIVVANPPVGQKIKLDQHDSFPVRSSNSTVLFIQHALSLLKEGGRAVFIVPQGLLSNKAGLQFRQMLVENHTIESIIALPLGVFLPYAGIQVSVLVLRCGGETNNIRMVDAASYFEKRKDRTGMLIRNSLTKVLVDRVRSTTVFKDSRNVNIEALIESSWDFSPRRYSENDSRSVFTELSKSYEVATLKSCCKVTSGKNINSQSLVKEPPYKGAVSYIRIRDIQLGQVSKGTFWLREESVTNLDFRTKLHSGDILLSRSGTIGKVGIVQNSSVNAVAANGLYIIQSTTDKVDPHFLLAYFNSPQCKSWLSNHSTGAYIKYLSKSVIEDLPVPMPPLNIQKEIVRLHSEGTIDVVSYLTALGKDSDLDPLIEWIVSRSAMFSKEIDNLTNLSDLRLINRVSSELNTFYQVEGDHSDSGMYTWVWTLASILNTLKGIKSIPRGSGLLAFLQDLIRDLTHENEFFDENFAYKSEAQRFITSIINWLEKIIQSLFEDVKIQLSTEIETLDLGKTSDIEIKITNKGGLPVRELTISTLYDSSVSVIDYLVEGANKSFHLKGFNPEKQGAFDVNVHWKGLSINGKALTGTSQLVFNVINSKDMVSKTKLDISESPYICGDPISPERNEVFFGREKLLKQINRYIVKSGNVVLLEGNRRSGKTSILKHLEGKDCISGWLGVYCSLQGAEGSCDAVGVPTVEVFREMAKSIAKAVHSLKLDTPLPNDKILPFEKKLGISKSCREGITKESPFSDFRDYVEVILELLKEKDLNMLLMMDEFDKLQEGIDNGVTSPQVPENIRFLVQTYPGFSAILTGSRRLKRLREEYWSALFGLGTRIGVTALIKGDAIKLITWPVKTNLAYSNEAMDEAYQLTAGQPYLLQCLCNRIYDIAAQQNIRSITLDTVTEASDKLIEDNEHFASLWNYAGSDRCRYILALFQKQKERSGFLHLGLIQELLLMDDIEVQEEKLINDLEYLRELELIKLVSDDSDGHYNLTLPLMGKWIDEQQDYKALKTKAIYEMEEQND